MKLFPNVGQPQFGARLQEKRVRELIGPGRYTGRVEEEMESFNGVGALGVGSDDGIEVERSWGRERVENEAGVSEVAGGRESGESEEF